jgi:hypothetical protein
MEYIFSPCEQGFARRPRISLLEGSDKRAHYWPRAPAMLFCNHLRRGKTVDTTDEQVAIGGIFIPQ